MKKQYIPAKNCRFHLRKGILTVLPTSLSFNHKDWQKVYKMAIEHSKRKKIRQPVKINKIDTIPVLMVLA